MYAAGKHYHLKPKFVTKASEEVEAKEDTKRMNLKKMQISFCYERLNDSYLSEKPRDHSNDYVATYSSTDMEAKPVRAKTYAPPLILESNIIELENILSAERILNDLSQKVFSTVLKNTIFLCKSKKCSNFSKVPQTSTDSFDDLFESTNDFLNSDEGCIKGVDMVDFNAQLPDHSPKQNTSGKCKKSQSQKFDFLNKSKSSNQIRTTNLPFHRKLDGSGSPPRRGSYKEENLFWKKKPVKDESSCVHTHNETKNNELKSKPAHVYTRDQMIRLSGKENSCSYCRTHDPVHRTKDHYWCYMTILSRFAKIWINIYCFDESGASNDQHFLSTSFDEIVTLLIKKGGNDYTRNGKDHMFQESRPRLDSSKSKYSEDMLIQEKFSFEDTLLKNFELKLKIISSQHPRKIIYIFWGVYYIMKTKREIASSVLKEKIVLLNHFRNDLDPKGEIVRTQSHWIQDHTIRRSQSEAKAEKSSH
ncbi:hypothetical protein L6452_17205 [Arctium lappa]|uniref:Uncharacterized protein n=1 Tax=Arctium lappa TaxID=4217 RepID=A0ACB9C2M1_ARCLA|nr:hypothetical protein L6452_17205 [Arctium lappa]